MNIFENAVNSQKEAQAIAITNGTVIRITSAKQVEALEEAIQGLILETTPHKNNVLIFEKGEATKIGRLVYNVL